MHHNLNQLTRRSALKLGGAGSLAMALPTVFAHSKSRIPYGVAVHLDPFRNEPRMKELLIKHADLIVPMNALKWASLRHTKNEFDFGGADEIISFAEAYGKSIHGHALLWYHANPSWLDAITSPSRLEGLLNEHIEKVVGRYAGRIATWDVVNEVVAHDPLSEGKWRRGVWYDALGPSHVDIAFKAAAKADPTAKLFINDYDLEDDSPRTYQRHKSILKIIRRLQDKNIPIHGVGFQSHLYAERNIGRDNLFLFLSELKSMGLEVAITELDVIDWRLPADPEERDILVANTAKEFLSAIAEVATPRNITSWGLSDKFSWIDETFPRDDAAKARPLPFDSNWTAKPLFKVLQSF